MSSRSSKTDLIVRVRYQNHLPPPPFPPRLLHIATSPHRYAGYQALNALSSERELPMILDGELGMPLELGKLAEGSYGDGEYWIGNRSAVVPTGTAPPPHEDDMFLLGDVSAPSTSSSTAPVAIPLGGGTSTMGERRKVDVSWLRRTEYLSSDPGSKVPLGNGAFSTQQSSTPSLDSLTRPARASAIASSFASAHTPLADLRHPSKPHLRAEEAWDILPDTELWANQLNLVRFGEDPSERDARDSHGYLDPRLPRALFRPVELPNDDNRVGYYLPVSDQVAETYTQLREDPEAVDADALKEGGGFEFAHVRDYEITTTRALTGEYVFVFHDGEGLEPDQGAAGATSSGEKEKEQGEGEREKKRPRGAYFTPVRMAQTVRKRRPRRGEDPTVFPQDPDRGEDEDPLEFWDKINVNLGAVEEILPEQEKEERDAQLKKVLQPPERV